MPKMKTRRSAAKRFKLTSKKKIMHYKSGSSHLLEHETAKMKRQRRGATELNSSHKNHVRKMLAV